VRVHRSAGAGVEDRHGVAAGVVAHPRDGEEGGGAEVGEECAEGGDK
jgi:hypothetical protein